MSRANAAQDFLPASRNNPDLHFDAERLVQGRTLLAGALRETVVAARAFQHALARQRLGAALHALQVTYSAFSPASHTLGGRGVPCRSWQHFWCPAGVGTEEGEEDMEVGGGLAYPRGY